MGEEVYKFSQLQPDTQRLLLSIHDSFHGMLEDLIALNKSNGKSIGNTMVPNAFTPSSEKEIIVNEITFYPPLNSDGNQVRANMNIVLSYCGNSNDEYEIQHHYLPTFPYNSIPITKNLDTPISMDLSKLRIYVSFLGYLKCQYVVNIKKIPQTSTSHIGIKIIENDDMISWNGYITDETN